MPLYDAASIERILSRMDELRDRAIHALDEFAPGTPYGMVSLSDEEFVLWFEQQVQASPPVPMAGEDGVRVIASPFLAMLPYTDNGDELLRRYERLTGLRETRGRRY